MVIENIEDKVGLNIVAQLGLVEGGELDTSNRYIREKVEEFVNKGYVGFSSYEFKHESRTRYFLTEEGRKIRDSLIDIFKELFK